MLLYEILCSPWKVKPPHAPHLVHAKHSRARNPLLDRHSSNPTKNFHTNPSPTSSDTSDVDTEDDELGDTGPDTQNEGFEDDFEECRHSPTPSEFVPLPEEPQMELVKVLYPGRRAGEVLSEGIPTMTEYENNLGGPTPNPYSPFNSKVDWELAKWARLCGPSATSFTELLQIDGVCPIHPL